MQFQDIVGQDASKKAFLQIWRSGHMPHALLITGREGTGGLPFALAIAQYIFCVEKTESDACGVCPSCRKIHKLEHADLHLSFPTIVPKPGVKAMSRYFLREFREFIAQTPYGTTFDWLQFIGAENKQGNITAEECREIIETLHLKSYEGGKKLQIIWRPEYLGKEGNILLKLIEEPPADTLLLLVAEDTTAILPTILSRTQALRLSPISSPALAEALIQRKLCDVSGASRIAPMAAGSYTEALRLVRQEEYNLFPEIRRCFNAIFKNNQAEISRLTEDWAQAGREQLKNLLQYIVQLLGYTIRIRHTARKTFVLPPEEEAFIDKLASMSLDTDSLYKMSREIGKAIYHIEGNAHSKTQLLALCIRLGRIIRKQEIPAL